jgi:hypothetical protein
MDATEVNRGSDQESHFMLVPNPAKNEITLYFTLPVYDYKLYIADSSGRIVHTETGNTPEKTIDVSKMAKGMYFVVVYEKKEFYQTRFIKN